MEPSVRARLQSMVGHDVAAVRIHSETPSAGCEVRATCAGPVGVPPVVYEVLRSPGTPLGTGIRQEMEDHLGVNLGHVRVHTDQRAAASADAVNALAYTVGNSVVFG